MVRKILLYSTGAVGLIALASLFLLSSFIPLDSYRPDFESVLSDTLGVPLEITGTMGCILWPDSRLFIKNVRIDNDFASLEEVEVGLNLYQLFKGTDYIDYIKIIEPHISLVRFRNGTLNFSQSEEKTKDDGAEQTGISPLPKIIIENGRIVYSDLATDSVTEATGLYLELKDLFLNTVKRNLLQALSFEGSIYTKNINSRLAELSDLTFQVKATEGLYHIQPFIMNVFNGKATGRITADLTGTTPHLNLNSAIAELYLEEFASEFAENNLILGKSDFLIDLSFQGSSMTEILKSAKGSFSLQGDNLMVKRYDIDRILANYRKSQKFGALDIGAFFLAGPLGTAITKGYNFEEVYRELGRNDGKINKFISKWTIEKGSIIADDVAFCTEKNMMALQGKLDLINARFDKVTAAVIDEKGCAEFTQKIYGSFDNPQFGKTTLLKSLAGAFISLFRKTGQLMSGNQCKTFYSGSIQHPFHDLRS